MPVLYMHCVDTCASNFIKQTHFPRVETCRKILAVAYETLSACSAVKQCPLFDVRRKLKTIGRISARKPANVGKNANLF